MKVFPLVIAAILLAGCAQSTVKKTYVATTTPYPRSIYIKPFDASKAVVKGWLPGSRGEEGLQTAKAPIEFADALRDEMSKLAPAIVLNPGEVAPEGWLMSGSLDLLDSGDPFVRATPFGCFGVGRSTILIHVKVTDAKTNQVLFAFDVSGGSGMTSKFGNTGAPGLGPSRPFDFKNAAERIQLALSHDYDRYGTRDSH